MSIDFLEILLVDDDVSLHDIISNTIDGLKIFNKEVKILHAHNADEAKELIKTNSDISIAFIDVAMETPDAGLKLVNYIRHTLHNENMRIIIIDSEDSPIPADDILEHYDINDYKDRVCIESQRLFNTVRIAIKQYQQFKDIQDSKAQMYEKMTTNKVTGLPNRMKLSQNIGTVGKKSLILLNIDDFSVINNHNGFEFGDKVLNAFADFLVKNYSKDAQVFHLEADIFAMLYLQEDISSVEEKVIKIKDDIYNHLFVIDSISIHLTATLGIVLNDHGNIIQKAEFAFKEARLNGKNSVQKYSDKLNILRTIHANSLWTGRIRSALEKKNILAYFQPILNIKTGKIEKYETLVRIEYKGEIYSPYHFLDAARYSGQLFEIFKLMFDAACKNVSTSNYDFTVNVSDYDLKHPKFCKVVEDILKRYKIDTKRITFEILENNSISKHAEIQKVLNKLHDLGCKLAIDDFGAECSNFGQLKNLKIDFIKIDGVFIKNIVEDKNSQIVAQTILDFAHKKGIPVIAEYVCSQEVYDYVKKMGVDYAQGYLISEPKASL
ncbi:EAL domain-containing protein [Sulfurimonas sp. SAG-AH-194-L11]|nr:GGDEF and EAL domain-containing protein [Sulfurimonas sp. SAG-AH-194-L11]MDF1876826.1 EAL domain-containing protein [Sulfurimonas sp. SAG-AH-194-L11]